jgi:hypothetical protein
MALHLVKLCVGADSIQDLRDWVSQRSLLAIAAGLEPHSVHTTRMFPKRAEELLDGGSLYWVIKGQVLARQNFLDVSSSTGADGISRCNLILGPEVIETSPAPKRPFQGWRYLKHEEAPRDLGGSDGANDELPSELKRELAELGLL